MNYIIVIIALPRGTHVKNDSRRASGLYRRRPTGSSMNAAHENYGIKTRGGPPLRIPVADREIVFFLPKPPRGLVPILRHYGSVGLCAFPSIIVYPDIAGVDRTEERTRWEAIGETAA